MELDEVMRTTFACREWTDEDVSDETVYDILDLARFAPNGGNRQGWRVIVLRDRELRSALVPLARPTTNQYAAQVAAGEAPWNTVVPSGLNLAAERTVDRPFPGLDAMVDAPVVLVVTVDLAVVASFDSELERVGVISGASIYPFVWNILMAARSRGLGGVLTTYLAGCESAVQDLLGIPAQHAVAALVPIGHPVRQLTRLRRLAVEEFTTVDHFDGAPFTNGQ